MQITRADLDAAATNGVLRTEQGGALWAFLLERQRERHDPEPSFRPAHILYYLGGMLAIGAMTLFMTLGWERLGAPGLLLIALVYGAAAVLLTEHLLHRRHLLLPAGITAVLAVVMVPLAVYAAQHLLGLWPGSGASGDAYRDYHARIDARWIFMELATLLAGVLALRRYRLPFLVLPVAVTLWYMSMDLVPLLLGVPDAGFFSDAGRRISMVFGLLMTLLAFWVDVRSRHTRDFAFWLYIFGVLTFWGGLTSLDASHEFGRFVYACVNVLLIALGAALSRRVFAVFGALGVALYLGHLSYTVFRDSLLFPLALTALGAAVIAAGVLWQRHEARIGAGLRGWLPGPVRELLESRMAG